MTNGTASLFLKSLKINDLEGSKSVGTDDSKFLTTGSGTNSDTLTNPYNGNLMINGKTLSTQTAEQFTNDQELVSKAYVDSQTQGDRDLEVGGDTFLVVVGVGTNSIAYSTDNGRTWTGITDEPMSSGNASAYGNGKWVAVGGGGGVSIAYSTDGITWTGAAYPFTAGYGVAYGNGLFVALGNTTGNNSIVTSSDGIIWTGRGSSIFTSYGTCATYANGLWVAGGVGSNCLAYSTDGINWTGIGTALMANCFDVIYADNTWIAVGSGGSNSILTSTDGITWTGLGYLNSSQAIAYSGSVYVISGSGGLTYSSDLTTWTPATSTLTNGEGVVWIGDKFLATGTGGEIQSSTDGVTWTTVSTGLFSEGRGFGVKSTPATLAISQGTVSINGPVYFKNDDNSVQASVIAINDSLNLFAANGINVINGGDTTINSDLRLGTPGNDANGHDLYCKDIFVTNNSIHFGNDWVMSADNVVKLTHSSGGVIDNEVVLANPTNTGTVVNHTNLAGDTAKTNSTVSGIVEDYTAKVNILEGQPVALDIDSAIKITTITSATPAWQIVGVATNACNAGDIVEVCTKGFCKVRKMTTYESPTLKLLDSSTNNTAPVGLSWTFKDSGIDNNYGNNENYNITFDAQGGGNWNLTFNSFTFEHTTSSMYDRLGIQTSSDGVVFTNVSIPWMQTGLTSFAGSSWSSLASRNGFILPKDMDRAISLGWDQQPVTINARYIRFTFFSDGSSTEPGWNISLVSSNYGGGISTTVPYGSPLYLDTVDYDKVSTSGTNVVGYSASADSSGDSIYCFIP